MFKKVNKINYMFLTTYYKLTSEMVNLKIKKKKTEEADLNID